ncbi:UDP-4-amino-4,6-dideoxy-N-acetyl-beta-L-altrosamine N-acetyltransferase [Desulfosporosinus sp. FKA]|uniref:UDP-4-amino-4, 6-dideoxy-N-acetyl-beta-L-altrosamine N-acetyltransferase n=1 Tax=Desulfosporosinus sp. FKA TaxID=1969834 RepID=UPI000B4A38C1|nr:UDP-4-amino-4,6-dideoxy-N-acetyl-beta-L-altrosamine N-acetyltransferase [Desulfosporosinus sp. FKA]
MRVYRDYQLRPLEKCDLERVLCWRNSDRVRGNMFLDHIITREEHFAWFKRIQADNANSRYMIFEFEGKPLGLVKFTDIDSQSARCKWGFYLGEEGLPPGTGLTMGLLGVEFAFYHLKIRKLCSEVLAFNLRSINFHIKLGFSEEGRFIQHIWRNDRYEDIVYFALFKNDWERHNLNLYEIKY